MTTTKLSFVAALAVGAGFASAASAADLTKVAFGTNWVAEGEHGGFYQAVVDGTYEACGLDVTIIPGGPQVNNRALMLAGKIDFHMGGDMLQAFSAVDQGIPVKVIAAIMQKHPQVFITHPGKAKSFDDLKSMSIMVGDNGFQSFYQWMIKAKGFSADQRIPYTYNPAPFIADETKAMQGYLTSEPYAVETNGGFTPEVFLIADAGYATYATTIETMEKTLTERPEVVKCFVEGSILGWNNYLYGDNAAANALIKDHNPDMSDGQIAYTIEKMIEYGIIDSGDTETLGIGAVTMDRVKGFYDDMVAVGVVADGIDYEATVVLDYVNQGLGLDVKKKLVE